MLDKKRIKELLEASVDGTITAKQVTAAGLHRSILQELVDRHILVEAKEDEDYFYYPAMDFHSLSVGDIIIHLSRVEESTDEVWKREFMTAIRAGYANDKLI